MTKLLEQAKRSASKNKSHTAAIVLVQL